MHSSPERPRPQTAVTVHAAGDLRVGPAALPQPTADQAVVAVAYGGVCGSDLHYWRHGAAGESVLRAPMVLGHEVVGTVLRPAADGSGPQAGTPVAVHPAGVGPSDGSRYPADRPNIAPGVTYLGSAAHFPHRDGAFASTIAVPRAALHTIPEGLPLRTAVIVEPAAVAWHAVARAGDVRGKRVLVVGSGPIGLLVTAIALRGGAAEVVAVDVHDRPLRIARELGATAALHATDADAIAAVDADVTIESSGSPRGFASAVHGTTRGGRVVMLGLQPTGEQPALLSLVVTRELEVTGSFRFVDEITPVLEALADGSLRVDPIITHSFDVEDTLEAFEVAADPSRSSKVLLRF